MKLSEFRTALKTAYVTKPDSNLFEDYAFVWRDLVLREWGDKFVNQQCYVRRVDGWELDEEDTYTVFEWGVITDDDRPAREYYEYELEEIIKAEFPDLYAEWIDIDIDRDLAA